MIERKRVLILCTGNSARSQMAEAFLRNLPGHDFDVESAGVSPTQVRSEAIAVMEEIGISADGLYSKSVDEFAGQEFDYVITVCDNAKESCPIFPGPTKHIHWSFDDPASAIGNEEERLEVFRRVRDEIADKLTAFASESEV